MSEEKLCSWFWIKQFYNSHSRTCYSLFVFYLFYFLKIILFNLLFCSLFLLPIAADVLLWRRRRVSIGAIVAATVSWLLLERSGLSCLTVCSDILLILVVLQFLRANYAVFRNRYDFLPFSPILSTQTVFNEDKFPILCVDNCKQYQS